jgi:hypothetical protein
VGDDAAAAAALHPATFLLRLERVGLHPGGSANEADKFVLGEFAIESGDLLTSDFRYFDLSAAVTASDIGAWLRVGVYAPADLAGNGTPWSVKLDALSLNWSAPAASDVPEPGSMAAAWVCGSLLISGRRRRRRTAGDRIDTIRLGARVSANRGAMAAGLRETGPRRAKWRLFLVTYRATSAWRNAHARAHADARRVRSGVEHIFL